MSESESETKKRKVDNMDGDPTQVKSKEAESKEAEQSAPEASPVVKELQRNDDGEAILELSTKRRCTIRKWKSSIMVDIREVMRNHTQLCSTLL